MNLILRFDLFLFDLDGVIYIGDKITNGTRKLLNKLRKKNKSVIFLTNNPTHSKSYYLNKLINLGIKAQIDEILTSTDATTYFIRKKYRNPRSINAYIIGSPSFKRQVKTTGINVIKDNDKMDKKCHLVIMGGHKKFNFNEIRLATNYINNGAGFLVTNKDPYYPTPDGPQPATGSLVSSIETSTGKVATVSGKPEPHMFELCLEKTKIVKNKTVLIGDSIETDIRGGRNYGIKTVLVLTGITSKKELKNVKLKPNFLIDDLSKFQ